MAGRIAALVLSGTLAGVGIAFAQDLTPGTGVVEVTHIPAGSASSTSKGDAPSFGNYGFETAFSFNFNHHVGIKGELCSMLSTTSDLQFGDTKAPNLLSYTASVAVTPWTGHSVQPYSTGGVSGPTMFERPGVGVFNDAMFLSGDEGGGVTRYEPNNRWGLRGDDRFAATRSKDDAPAFFGSETRCVHRVYITVVINTSVDVCGDPPVARGASGGDHESSSKHVVRCAP